MKTRRTTRGWATLAALLLTLLLLAPGNAAALSTPSLVSPSNGSNYFGTAVTFSWNAVTDANNYYFQLAVDAGFTTIVYGSSLLSHRAKYT